MQKTLLLLAGVLAIGLPTRVNAQYADWRHEGSLYILTTPGGADLPASASVKDFPLLVRLHRDHFPFSEAASGGSDIRFSAGGRPLSYEIDEWDRKAGTASIWVRIPLIRGNERQEIKIHWGKPDAPNASDGKAVFNASNGYVGVWHLGGDVRDVTGNLESEDKGTTMAEGLVGAARHFPGKMGVFCGKEIEVLPAGGATHSTQAWFRPESSNGRVVAWGNEKRQGKVTMLYQSPPRVRMDCYFSSADVRAEIPGGGKGWTHAVHTYEDGQAVLYINGEKQGAGNPRAGALAIEKPARLWIGGWYNNYDYIGDIDEVRVSGVARSAGWVRLEYENQKPMQTLVGPVVQDGDAFSVSPSSVTMQEGGAVALTAKAGGAQKVFWSMVQGNVESVIATDRFGLSLDAGRVSGDRSFRIRFDAVYGDEVKSIEVPVTVKEALPEPQFVLKGPASWDGRETIEVRPQITNLEAMQKAGVGELDYRWEVSGLATVKDEEAGTLVLSRAQNSGKMIVTLSLANGGDAVSASTMVMVQEPETDAWVPWDPAENEMPLEGQFYARDDNGKGTLHCKGSLEENAEKVFLRVFAEDRKFAEESAEPGKDGSYAFAIKLDAALVKYRIEFGTRSGGGETVLHRAGDIVCGDAYLIEGQSNALATDTREESPRVTNEWIRSYGRPQFYKEGERENLWCNPVWKANNKEKKEYLAELGWWGMELGKRLVESQKVPVFILNGAKGGTRIDQHQRNDEDPTDLETIYGRMLWRMREARLTHGIRGVIWHQGESDQGAAGPDGGYGWETYQRYFVDMSADWKRDFPNVSRYYLYQIWPNACSMGAGNGDMMREVQRTLPRLYSNMEVLSTLGIKPPGGCHYPLTGWSEFARMVQPLIERDFYGRKLAGPMTPANLKQVYYTSAAKEAIALEFDQPVVWGDDLLASQFYLDDVDGAVVRGNVAGNVLTLTLNKPATFERITYLKEISWKQENILMGENGIAALTFCNVPISSSKPADSAKASAGPSKEDAARFSYYLGHRDGKKIAGNPKQKPGDIELFMLGLRIELELEPGVANEGLADFKKGRQIGTQIARFAEQRFPALDRARIADGFAAGLTNEKAAYTNDELNAAVKACTKFVKTPKPEKHALLGKPAPQWEVGPWYQLPEGKDSLDISDFKGKVLYMYCFQSWCPGCHSRGFPTLQKVSEKYKDDDDVGFVVFQTVFEDRADKPVNTFENLKKVAAKFSLTMPFAQSGSREDKSKVMRAYKTRGTPWTVIIDRKGVIRYSGFHITPDEASTLIEELKK